ncbi:MAG: hypothetical protein OSA99_11645 [Acidimicrobiales bacterium]|nr:hypothetical protein [Acidimicrobiales bacterium]
MTVADDIFTSSEIPFDDAWEGDPRFLLLTEDREGAAAALHAAGNRFSTIDEEGRELAAWELTSAETYTPNFVSDVVLLPEGPMIWADTKGGFSHAMGQAMLDVLVAELDARGVDAQIGRPPVEYDHSAPTWTPPPTAPGSRHEAGTVTKSWYIGRTVASTTTTGRHYDEHVWRTSDGRWIPQRTSAERFDEPPIELIEALREEPRSAELGEVNGLLLPDDDSDRGAMPPASIRQRST